MAALFAEMTLIDWIGVLGSICIGSAYFAVSNRLVDPQRPPFHLINLTGALLILWSLYYRPNAGAILIEVLWIGIALWGLISYARRG